MKKAITFTFDEDLIKRLKKVSDETMIPQSRIVENAVREKLDAMTKAANQ